MKTQIVSPKAQSAPGLLSQAIEANGFIFTAGFIHVTPDGKMVEGSTQEKFQQVMKNIEEVLLAAGTTLQHVVKVTIYITDISLLAELNHAYKQYFSEALPAREAVCVQALPLGASIELSVVAVKP